MLIFNLILLRFITASSATSDQLRIVCNECVDYVKKSENCELNHDVLSDTVSIIKRHGYLHEIYNVTTEDGIRTPIYRIFSSKNNGHNTPILLQHGLQMDATIWITRGQRSLAFRLSDMNYDVWLGNFRNSHHSVQVNYDPNRYFYNFSYHDLAIYDLKATIKLIAAKTNRSGDIIYLAHSMGTTAGFIYAIEEKYEAERHLRGIITLGPAAFLNHCPHFFDGKYITRYMVRYFPGLLERYGYGALFDITGVQETMVKFCIMNELTCKICYRMVQFVSGYNSPEFSPKDLPIMMSYALYSNPLKVLVHYIIAGHYDNFTKYDYQSTPDDYNIYDLKRIKLPVALFYGVNDKFADEKDTFLLYDALETEKYMFNVTGNNGTNGFSHLDFMFAKDIEPFYEQLFKIIKNFTNINSNNSNNNNNNQHNNGNDNIL